MLAFLLSHNLYSQQDTATDFTVIDIDGNSHHLYDYLNAGHYVLIDFFGTSCYHCENLVPELNKVYLKYGCNNAQLKIIGINDDRGNAQIEEFKKEFGALYPSASGFEGGGKAVFDIYDITYLPRLIIVSPDKMMVVDDIPKRTFENIDTILQNLGVKDSACIPSSFPERFNSGQLKIFIENELMYYESEFEISQISIYSISGKFLSTVGVEKLSGFIQLNSYSAIYIVVVTKADGRREIQLLSSH